MDFCMADGCQRHVYDSEQLCAKHLKAALALLNVSDCEIAVIEGAREHLKCSRGKTCDCYVVGVAEGTRKECDKWLEWLRTRTERGFAWKRL